MIEMTLQSAQYAYQAGQFAEAGRLYHQILRTNPRHFDALYGLGLVYLQGQQFDQAEYLFSEAVRVDPQACGPAHFRVLEISPE